MSNPMCVAPRLSTFTEQPIQPPAPAGNSIGAVQKKNSANRQRIMQEIIELEAQSPYKISVRLESIQNPAQRKDAENALRKNMLWLATGKFREIRVNRDGIPSPFATFGTILGRCGFKFYLKIDNEQQRPIVNGLSLPHVNDNFEITESAFFGIGENNIILSGGTIKIHIEPNPGVSTKLYEPKLMEGIVKTEGTGVSISTLIES